MNILPTGFVPDEDQGYFIVAVQLPEGASMERNDVMMRKIEAVMAKESSIKDVLELGSYNFV